MSTPIPLTGPPLHCLPLTPMLHVGQQTPDMAYPCAVDTATLGTTSPKALEVLPLPASSLTSLPLSRPCSPPVLQVLLLLPEMPSISFPPPPSSLPPPFSPPPSLPPISSDIPPEAS